MARTGKNTPAPSSPMVKDDWEAREGLRTLSRADEIRKNKPLMREIKAEAKKQIKAVGAVLGGSTRKRK